LTFNTTFLSLERALRDGALVRREPVRPQADGSIRTIFVRHELMAMLDGDAPGHFPAVEWEVAIRTFCVGALLTVSFKRNKLRPDIERLGDYDEVWAICARKPKPGWRLLGRFLQPDCFIGLEALPKGVLANRYDEAAADVTRRWGEIFGSQAPWRGNRPGDYMTGALHDLDAHDE
jgi:hypothetical protein